MFKNILVTLDGSELAEKILPHAEEIAKAAAGKVIFLRVVHADVMGGPLASGGDIRQALMEEASRAEAYLEKIAKKFEEKGIKTDTVVEQGDASSKIIDYAHKNKVDMICMTTHGRSGLSHVIMGSVAEKVTKGVLSPVLLVRALTVIPRHIDEQEVWAASGTSTPPVKKLKKAG